jgi:hypothetical protein
MLRERQQEDIQETTDSKKGDRQQTSTQTSTQTGTGARHTGFCVLRVGQHGGKDAPREATRRHTRDNRQLPGTQAKSRQAHRQVYTRARHTSFGVLRVGENGGKDALREVNRVQMTQLVAVP